MSTEDSNEMMMKMIAANVCRLHHSEAVPTVLETVLVSMFPRWEDRIRQAKTSSQACLV